MVLRRVSIPHEVAFSSEEQIARRSDLFRQDLEIVQNVFIGKFESIPASGQVIKVWTDDMCKIFTGAAWRANLVNEGKWAVLTSYVQLLYCLIEQHYLTYDQVSNHVPRFLLF